MTFTLPAELVAEALARLVRHFQEQKLREELQAAAKDPLFCDLEDTETALRLYLSL